MVWLNLRQIWLLEFDFWKKVKVQLYYHHHCHHQDVITLIAGSCPGLWTPGAQSEEFWTLYSLCWLSLLQRILILIWYFALMCRITHNAGDMLIGVDWAVFWCNHWKYVDPGDGNLVMTKSGNMVIGDPDWRRENKMLSPACCHQSFISPT